VLHFAEPLELGLEQIGGSRRRMLLCHIIHSVSANESQFVSKERSKRKCEKIRSRSEKSCNLKSGNAIIKFIFNRLTVVRGRLKINAFRLRGHNRLPEIIPDFCKKSKHHPLRRSSLSSEAHKVVGPLRHICEFQQPPVVITLGLRGIEIMD
jgi:hypothetical protein